MYVIPISDQFLVLQQLLLQEFAQNCHILVLNLLEDLPGELEIDNTLLPPLYVRYLAINFREITLQPQILVQETLISKLGA